MSLTISRERSLPSQMILLDGPQQKIQCIEMIKGQRFKPELNVDAEDTILILKGNARIKIGSETRAMTPISLVKLTANKIAKIYNDQEEPLKLFWIKATVSLLERQTAADGLYIKRKEECFEFVAPKPANLERIYELFGKENGNADMQSVALVEIAPGGFSGRHYHPIVNETYLITEGEGKLMIDSQESTVKAGDTVVIPVGLKHKIINIAGQVLKLVVVVTPPWTVECGVYDEHL